MSGAEADRAAADRRRRVRELRARRPRRRALRRSLYALAVLVPAAWLAGDFNLRDLLAPQRLANLRRFAGKLVPHPMQGGGGDWGDGWHWLVDLLHDRGWEALEATLAISVVAIILAAVVGGATSFLATRNLATPDPFTALRGHRWQQFAWASVVALVRGTFIFARAIPEYLWAFLLLMVFGPGAWPAILALALHNAGILGKLNAELIEDLPTAPMVSLRALGARRRELALAAILPISFPRFLMLFFYRWETCVREATVLGMLGIVSLGYWVEDARARQHYDDMLVFILLGSLLVVIGDQVSIRVREWIRARG